MLRTTILKITTVTYRNYNRNEYTRKAIKITTQSTQKYNDHKDNRPNQQKQLSHPAGEQEAEKPVGHPTVKHGRLYSNHLFVSAFVSLPLSRSLRGGSR